MKSFQTQTHYEVLEISVAATSGDVRNAYERLTQLYADDQVVLYGLIDLSRAHALRSRLKEAFDVLIDESRRDAYDEKIGLPPREMPKRSPVAPRAAPPVTAPAPSPWAGFTYLTPVAPVPAPSSPNVYTYSIAPPVVPIPLSVRAPPIMLEEVAPLAQPIDEVLETPVVEVQEPVPVLVDDGETAIVPARDAQNREFRVEPRPKIYEMPDGVEINGDLLRQVRLAKGLSLAQVAERTRIGVKHLENVEGDRYDMLPAAVYLRGILMSLAKELGLDGMRVSRSYLTFVEAHRSKG